MKPGLQVYWLGGKIDREIRRVRFTLDLDLLQYARIGAD
jgi:hypothetical protein